MRHKLVSRLSKIGLKRCNHVSVNSPPGHAHPEMTAVLFMKAEAESNITPVKCNVVHYINWISTPRLFSLLDRYRLNIFCIVTCDMTGCHV